MLCPYLSEVHKDNPLWCKRCPMPFGLLQATLVNSFKHSAVLLCQNAKSQGIHIVNKASPRSWEGQGVVGFDKVGNVEEEDNL